jgi:hypothetical protein
MVEAVQQSTRGIERMFRLADLVAGGRSAAHTISTEMRDHSGTRRTFAVIAWLLAAELVIGAASLGYAVLLQVSGETVGLAVWLRCCVVLAITVTLVYFAYRASLGYYWAYSRLRLFSRIFPVVTLVLCAIPGLYPLWMIGEQIVFSLLMIGMAEFLGSDHMRTAFPRPPRVARETAVPAEADQVVR